MNLILKILNYFIGYFIYFYIGYMYLLNVGISLAFDIKSFIIVFWPILFLYNNLFWFMVTLFVLALIALLAIIMSSADEERYYK